MGRYVIGRAGAVAELTYSVAMSTFFISDHNGVPYSFRCTGAGVALVMRLVADARAEGVKVVPLCPFVNATWKKHAKWADVFA